MKFRRVLARVAVAIGPLCAAGPGCSHESSSPRGVAGPPPAAGAPARGPTSGLRFRAEPLPFRYERGESGSAWPVEPTGGGVGMLDYDGDGDLDLFFAQGVPLPVGRCDQPPADVLLENRGGGRFEDVSDRVGLASRGYGQGVTVADYDGDGDPDVYVTRYGPNTLWRNDGATILGGPAGPMAIGDDVVIGRGAVVATSVIGTGSTIGSHAYIAGSTIPAGSIVPDGAIIINNAIMGTVPS